MTRDEIICQRRVRALHHAAETGNVSETCRVFGISRTRFYEWRSVAECYGIEALWPKGRRAARVARAAAITAMTTGLVTNAGCGSKT